MTPIPLSSWSAAATAAIVGTGGTIALVLAAAQAVGATPDQLTSWVTVICLAIAIESAALSMYYRMPIVSAWSAAGLALIGASEGFTLAEAVGAFIVTGLLLFATGLFPAAKRVVAAIPKPVAAGMLAGILIGFPLEAARQTVTDPLLALPVIAVFFWARRVRPALASIIAMAAGVLWIVVTGRMADVPALGFGSIAWVTPQFDPGAVVGLALPLYIVTMASQNLPGLAVLSTHGFHPPPGPPIAFTGLLSALSAPFCASTTNLSALTASICIEPDAHPDAEKRWVTGIAYGVWYGLFAAFGGSITGLVAALPTTFIALIAGLALLSPLLHALDGALREDDTRMAAVVTLVVTASGVTVFGVGAAFWGLAAGLAAHLAAERV